MHTVKIVSCEKWENEHLQWKLRLSQCTLMFSDIQSSERWQLCIAFCARLTSSLHDLEQIHFSRTGNVDWTSFSLRVEKEFNNKEYYLNVASAICLRNSNYSLNPAFSQSLTCPQLLNWSHGRLFLLCYEKLVNCVWAKSSSFRRCSPLLSPSSSWVADDHVEKTTTDHHSLTVSRGNGKRDVRPLGLNNQNRTSGAKWAGGRQIPSIDCRECRQEDGPDLSSLVEMS